MQLHSGSVILISSDGLGRGDEELGRLLMQRFLHELGGTSRKAELLIFINSGVALVADDSRVLAQLRRLQEQGMELKVCSTCLDRFGLTDRVRVGSITNMSEIVGTLVNADRVLSV